MTHRLPEGATDGRSSTALRPCCWQCACALSAISWGEQPWTKVSQRSSIEAGVCELTGEAQAVSVSKSPVTIRNIFICANRALIESAERNGVHRFFLIESRAGLVSRISLIACNAARPGPHPRGDQRGAEMSLPVQLFTEEQQRLRSEWFDLIETQDAWIDLGPIGHGESCPIRVENKRTGRRAAAKPGAPKAADDFCRAAHEKLAYDLAYLLELPVQPVVLWPDDAPAQYKRGRAICAWVFDQSATWEVATARGCLSSAQKQSAAPIFSAMKAFHVWISDLDRNEGQVRVNLENDGVAADLAFFDHSNSMSYSWSTEDPTPPNPPIGLPVPEMNEVIREFAERIARISQVEIERIVRRVTEPYLPELTREHILCTLLQRREKLPKLLRLK